jgi:hypothetical protein
MSHSILENCAVHELKYQARKRIVKEIEQCCPESDPMVAGAIVMLGSILAMAVFSSMLAGKHTGRIR